MMKYTNPTALLPLTLGAAFLLGTAPAHAQKAKHYPPHAKTSAPHIISKKTPTPKTPRKNAPVHVPPASRAYSPRWSPETLGSFFGLQVGMTRADVLRLYSPDGGISTRTRGRFIYKIPNTFGRQGEVLKINVGFAPASPAGMGILSLGGSLDPEADDVITFISEPYSDLMICD